MRTDTPQEGSERLIGAAMTSGPPRRMAAASLKRTLGPSPIAAFLARNPAGGVHHLCYEVDDLLAARDRLVAQGLRVLGSGKPSIGAHGRPVLFLHPKDVCGTLVELEEVG